MEARDISQDQWCSFLSSFSDASIFHSAGWLDAIVSNQRRQLRLVGIFAQQELIGVVPLFEQKLGLLRVAASPFVVEDTPYLGLMVKEGRFEGALAALADYQHKANIHFVRLMQREHCRDGALDYSGFDVIQKHTHLLDLSQTEEQLWAGMEGRCRTVIRKAQKNGVRVSRADHSDSMDVYYEMLSALYRRQRMTTPNCLGFYRDIWSRFNNRHLVVFFATVDNDIVAGAIIVRCNDTFYYLNGASRPEFNSLGVNNLIQWHAIQHAQSSGGIVYDFVGSDIPRLAAFKKSFGGRLTSHTCLERSSSKWVSRSRGFFPLYKRIKGRIMRHFGVG